MTVMLPTNVHYASSALHNTYHHCHNTNPKKEISYFRKPLILPLIVTT